MKYTLIKIKEYPLTKTMRNWGISDRKLAKVAGIDYSYLFRLRHGEYVATEKMANKIIKAIEKITKVGRGRIK